MRRGLHPGWRRTVFAVGGTLALAAVVVVIASAVAPAPAGPSPTVIAVTGPSASPESRAATPAQAAGLLLDGGVVIDQRDPAPFGSPADSGSATRVPRPLTTGPLNGLETGRWLLLWPFLLAVSLAAITLWGRRTTDGRPEAEG